MCTAMVNAALQVAVIILPGAHDCSCFHGHLSNAVLTTAAMSLAHTIHNEPKKALLEPTLQLFSGSEISSI